MDFHVWARPGAATLALVAALLVPPPLQAQHRSFYIDESTDFSGNGCENADLNEVTASLTNSLIADGWAGERWMNANAWPQDFYEQSFAGLSGLDGVYGDARTLAVYAGHGNRALLQYGFPRLGQCMVGLDTQARLGTLWGDSAGFAMYLTSCTINLDSLGRHFNNQLRQSFGYHNSPSVGDDQPNDFYQATSGLRNSRAWVEEMEDMPGWFTGDNSPITLTTGLYDSHCWLVHDNARLRGAVLLTPSPEPLGWFCYEMFDNGGC